MHVRHPIWLQGLGTPSARAFAVLFALESLTRAILSTVIPLQVFRLLGDSQQVSVVFFAVGVCGLCLNFTIPLIVRLISRRYTYSLGVLCLGLAAILFPYEMTGLTAAAMLLRVFGVACLAICLNLYILDYIKGKDLNRLEPLRLFFAAGAWTLGPWLGVFLWTEVAPWAPYAISGGSAAALLAYFWILRASDNRVIIRAQTTPPNPLLNIGRFWAQPRLRLAWLIATTRSAWWAMFFIYGPIFAVKTGLGEQVGGLMVSAGNALLFAAPLLGRLAQAKGVRWTVVVSFVAGGGLTLLAAAMAWVDPAVCAALLVAAAICAVALDVTGNLPFLRMVRPSQRASMTTVYVTYRDFSEVGPPGVFAILLKIFPLPAVFVASALSMFAMSYFARYLPRRM
jgi:hypothetical protein